MDKVHTCKVCKLSEPKVEFYNGKYSICKTCYTEKNKADYERRKLEKPNNFEDNNSRIDLLAKGLLKTMERVENCENVIKILTTRIDYKDKEIKELREKITSMSQEANIYQIIVKKLGKNIVV